MDKQYKSQEWLASFSNKIFSDPKKRLYWHIGIIAFVCLAAYSRQISYEPAAAFTFKGTILALLLILFYSNFYWLVPKYLFKRKFLIYFSFSFGFVILLYSTVISLMDHLRPYRIPDNDDDDDEMALVFFIFMVAVLIGASAAVRLFQQWVSDGKMIGELEKSKTAAELEQLKNQINPHFLFNMLNNANVLTKKDPDKASAVLMGLSDLLRYQLYDSTRDSVLLTADIHFLEDFLNLEKIRRDEFTFVVSKEGPVSGVQVSPLLFVTFVENAIKHSNDTGKKTNISVFFEVQDGQIVFKCINSKPAIKAINTAGGLGLANVKRRLDLLYPGKHELTIDETNDQFSVTLILNV